MANTNNWGEIYKSTWWGDKAWSANTLFIDSAPPGFGLNLLKASEDMDNTIDWRQVLSSVVANSTDEAAPNGTDTAEKITFTDDRQSRIQQKIALEANTTYTFSVYAKVRTGTKDFRLRNLTLGEQGAFTADTSWGLNPNDGRYSFSFTTGATAITHTLSIQNAAAAGTGEVFFWGAMLNEGATAGDYVKTEASVSGSAPAPAYSGFGDAFGGVAAYYSLRKFTEAETLNAIRVRRSSDDTEQDIGFDSNGDLDSTALLAFVGTGGTDNGFVTTFYDQSGNGNDATNATESEQPLVVSGGTLVEENGKAAVEFDGVNDELVNSSITLTQPFTYFHARKYRNTTTLRMALSLSTSTNGWADYLDGGQLRAFFGGSKSIAAGFNTNQNLWGAIVNGTSSQVLLNGTSTAANLGTNNGDAVVIGDRGNISGVNAAVNVQEIIIFDSDQSANRGSVSLGTGIEGNINTYFDIV